MRTIIYFDSGKKIKKNYETCMKAFFDYENKGCILVELFNKNGLLISKYKKP